MRVQFTPLRILLALALLWLASWCRHRAFLRQTLNNPLQPRAAVVVKQQEVLEQFRLTVRSEVLEPTRTQLGRIRLLYSKSLKDRPSDWESEIEDTISELESIVGAAYGTPVPGRYCVPYDDYLWGLHYTRMAALTLRQHLGTDKGDVLARKQAQKVIRKQIRQAQTLLAQTSAFLLEVDRKSNP